MAAYRSWYERLISCLNKFRFFNSPALDRHDQVIGVAICLLHQEQVLEHENAAFPDHAQPFSDNFPLIFCVSYFMERKIAHGDVE